MTDVIEARLLKYSQRTAVEDDMALIIALREILAAEEEKDENETDWDVIAEATDAILTLEGENVDSFEASEADAADFRRTAQNARQNDGENEIPDGLTRREICRGETVSKARASKLKWMIPIAAILAALLIGGAIAGAYYLDLFSMDADTYKSIPFGSVITGEEAELEKSDVRQKSDEVAAIAGDDKYDSLLVPDPLPDGWSVQSVVTDELSGASLVEIMLGCEDQRTVRVKALLGLGRSIPPGTERIGAFDVFVSEYDGIVQGEFTVGADYYLVQAPDRAALGTIIECMGAKK